jgi:hypothetical protein
MDINVKTATEIIEIVRQYLALKASPESIEEELENRFDIEPITKCDSETHSNPHIDNCGVCAPRWGWIGERITVKGRFPKAKI